MSFRHRIATLDDLPTIVAIYNSTIASREVTADTEPVSVESRLNWFHEHQPERRPLWVIERADDTSAQPEILGWISYSNFYGRPAYSGTAEVSIYIAESWRGKGIGRYALTEAIAYAPRIAVHTVLGFIFGHNAPSLALFRKFGFDEWAHFPRVANLDGIERDLIILGKRVA
ncbi:phosphinothricin acetyltransferase [Pseudoduganella flava]|uniref:GNAT family N-acetyltransferase n=1 Tax=Pseudoduganella flava TaxID=871742 RepID=A0A562PPZ9_9BURK|nr:GNAT family N-acetyltransferase [Pseudoduganella flava]QGZ37733.1 GNAT family N-acetyltransferase [Pseudoduganella flava]TWI46535.1 phosphinothricin acetyltransferase [Pseudoduganella flava]